MVFSHGFLMNHSMFDVQLRALGETFRCLAFDHRGQGQSETTVNGYDIDSLTEDAAALIRALNAAPCHFVGLSMGGFVGLRLAIRYPELLRSLTLIETSADPEPASSRFKYRIMLAIVRLFGFRPLTRMLMGIMFGNTYNKDPAHEQDRDKWVRSILAANKDGLVRTAEGILDRESVYKQLGKITVPTLIIVGDEDTATPWIRAERMRKEIPTSELVVVEHAGHSSTIEQPDTLTSIITDFLAGVDHPDHCSKPSAHPAARVDMHRTARY